MIASRIANLLSSLRLRRFVVVVSILIFSAFFFQNCSPNQLAFKSENSSGNGEPYNGKPGDFYRQVPGYTCAGTARTYQKLSLSSDKAVLHSINEANCNEEEKFISLDEVYSRAYNGDFVSIQDAVFERLEAAPVPTDMNARLPEMLCRSVNNVTLPLDVVVHETLATGSLAAKIYSSITSDEGSISKTLTDTEITYQSPAISLNINRSTHAGRLQWTQNTTQINLDVTCLAAGWLDPVISLSPSFAVNFSSNILPPDISFSRNSLATYVAANGSLQQAANNTPRFEFDVNGDSKGLLIEAAATNLLRYSEQLENAVYAVRGSITANQGVAPNGTTTADAFLEGSGSVMPYLGQAISANRGNPFACSVFMKAGSRDRAIVKIESVTATDICETHVSLADGSSYGFSNGAPSQCQSSVRALGSGWYRVAVSAIPDPAGTTGNITCQVLPTGTDNGGNEVLPYNGNNSAALLLWGFQMESGLNPTSYIATTAVAASRAADVATVGTGSWYNPNAGSILAVGQKSFFSGSSSLEKLFSLVGANGADYGVVYNSASNQFQAHLQAPNGGALTQWSSSVTPTDAHKLLLQYDATTAPGLYVDGTSSQASGAPMSPLNATQIELGGTSAWNGFIKTLVIWRNRLPTSVSSSLSQ